MIVKHLLKRKVCKLIHTRFQLFWFFKKRPMANYFNHLLIRLFPSTFAAPKKLAAQNAYSTTNGSQGKNCD